MYPPQIVFLPHFLDERGTLEGVPAPVRRRAEYYARIVAQATFVPPEGFHVPPLRCRRRPAHKPCDGLLEVALDEPFTTIAWRCPACGDSGKITGWELTIWDCSFDLYDHDAGAGRA